MSFGGVSSHNVFSRETKYTISLARHGVGSCPHCDQVSSNRGMLRVWSDESCARCGVVHDCLGDLAIGAALHIFEGSSLVAVRVPEVPISHYPQNEMGAALLSNGFSRRTLTRCDGVVRNEYVVLDASQVTCVECFMRDKKADYIGRERQLPLFGSVTLKEIRANCPEHGGPYVIRLRARRRKFWFNSPVYWTGQLNGLTRWSPYISEARRFLSRTDLLEDFALAILNVAASASDSIADLDFALIRKRSKAQRCSRCGNVLDGRICDCSVETWMRGLLNGKIKKPKPRCPHCNIASVKKDGVYVCCEPTCPVETWTHRGRR